MNIIANLWNDQRGFIVSTELVLIATILVIGLITGMSCLQSAIVQEFGDLSMAISSLNQNFTTTGFRGCKGSFTSGSAFWGNNWYRGYPYPMGGWGYGMGGYGGGGYGYGGGYGGGDLVGNYGFNSVVQGPPAPAKVIKNQYDACVDAPNGVCPPAVTAPVAPCDNCKPTAVSPSGAPMPAPSAPTPAQK